MPLSVSMELQPPFSEPTQVSALPEPRKLKSAVLQRISGLPIYAPTPAPFARESSKSAGQPANSSRAVPSSVPTAMPSSALICMKSRVPVTEIS